MMSSLAKAHDENACIILKFLSMIISLTGKSHKDANQTQISKAHTHFRMFASQANTIFPLHAQTTNRNSNNNNK